MIISENMEETVNEKPDQPPARALAEAEAARPGDADHAGALGLQKQALQAVKALQ